MRSGGQQLKHDDKVLISSNPYVTRLRQDAHARSSLLDQNLLQPVCLPNLDAAYERFKSLEKVCDGMGILAGEVVLFLPLKWQCRCGDVGSPEEAVA